MGLELTYEQWGDIVTLLVFGVLFGTKAELTIRRNLQAGTWDQLAKAIAVVNVVLVALVALSILGILIGLILPPPARWALRIVASGAAAWASIRLIRDRPGKLRRRPRIRS